MPLHPNIYTRLSPPIVALGALPVTTERMILEAEINPVHASPYGTLALNGNHHCVRQRQDRRLGR